MSRTDAQRKMDILEAAEDLARLAERGRAAFDEDLAVSLAMERLLEVIGEASSHLSEEFRNSFPSVDWRAIIDMRIVLAHMYHRVDPNLIWMMATTSVPDLVAVLRACVLFGECVRWHDRHHQVVAYSSDLTDSQWDLLKPLLLNPSKRGPKHGSDLRHVVNAMLYISHTGCQWR